MKLNELKSPVQTPAKAEQVSYDYLQSKGWNYDGLEFRTEEATINTRLAEITVFKLTVMDHNQKQAQTVNVWYDIENGNDKSNNAIIGGIVRAEK